MKKENYFNKNVSGQLIAIFLVQASSTIAFAVFYSGLSIYLTQNKNFPQESATYITGLFLSFNYFMPLLGGIIANRFVSYKKLYFLGTAASFFGCLFLARSYLFIGLSLFLLSSLTNVCLKMFLTQLFSTEQKVQRRVAFLWNYTGINFGFMLGFLLTGFFTLSNSYFYLFISMSAFVAISLVIAMIFINEPKMEIPINKPFWYQIIISLFIMGLIVSSIDILFHYANVLHKAITILTMILFVSILFYGLKKCKKSEIINFTKFICFSLFEIFFWTCYMLTPIALMQLIEYDVQRNLFNIILAPQWFSNIDSMVILIFAPILTVAIKRIKIFNKSSNYFSLGFLCLFCGFMVMLLGFYSSHGELKISLWVVLLYLLLVTFSEVFIAPISDSFIGEFIPESLRGLMTGSSRVIMCIGVLLSSTIANKFILPYINKGGLTIQDSVHLKQFFFFATGMILILLLLISPLLEGKKHQKKNIPCINE